MLRPGLNTAFECDIYDLVLAELRQRCTPENATTADAQRVLQELLDEHARRKWGATIAQLGSGPGSRRDEIFARVRRRQKCNALLRRHGFVWEYRRLSPDADPQWTLVRPDMVWTTLREALTLIGTTSDPAALEFMDLADDSPGRQE